MAASIHDIAAAAGVSTATVSRVFSGRGHVNPTTRERVLQQARQMGYTPKKYKRQAAGGPGFTAGVVVPDICNSYYMEVIQGIQEVLDERGAEMLICSTNEDPAKEIRCLNHLRQLRVQGIIVVPVSDAAQYNASFISEMDATGIPVVLLDRDVPGATIEGVFMDNYNAAYQSVATLAQNGHRDIAIISGPKTSTSAMERLKGYKDALHDAGLPPRADYIFYGDFKQDTAYTLTERLLRDKPGVTAIFAANSRMATGCLLALGAHGLQVPEDMGFIACGSLGARNGQISSVLYPTGEIGAECARLLLEKAGPEGKRHKGTKKRTTFEMQLGLCGSEKFPVNRKKLDI